MGDDDGRGQQRLFDLSRRVEWLRVENLRLRNLLKIADGAGPISFPGLLKQAVGRALRRHEGKTEVVVYDYVDAQVPVLRAQYSKRQVGYTQMGFRCERDS